jgi:SAM-dependent methyltransferase
MIKRITDKRFTVVNTLLGIIGLQLIRLYEDEVIIDEDIIDLGFTDNIYDKWFDTTDSPIHILINDEEIDSAVIRLKNQLEADESEEVQDAIRTNDFVKKVIAKPWWQRIKIPGTDVYTTSDHTCLQITNPGWLNTLHDKLTPAEGFILRPMPKWEYLKPIMPDVKEIGCNNGFFCFEFADAGASKITGLEVVEEFIKPAIFMKEARGLKHVNFFHTDALLDLSVERHDIVFMSEVHSHFVDPLFGILRAINLAKEHLVIDGAAINSDNIEIDLNGKIDEFTNKLDFHAWCLSDALMLRYLYLCGVEINRVIRYTAPWPNHIVYVIDTSNVEEMRKKNNFQPCNTSFINNQFRCCPAR